MTDRGGRLRFAQEPLTGRLIDAPRGQHHLESDGGIQLRVFSAENDAHATSTEDLKDSIGPEPADFVRRLRRVQELANLPIVAARMVRGSKGLFRPGGRGRLQLFCRWGRFWRLGESR